MNVNGIALGVIGVGLAAVSAYLRVSEKDGGGWAVAATLFLLSSCHALGG